MKHKPWRSLAAALLLMLSVAASAATPAPHVRVTTNMGQFVIELAPDRAPLTVANFLRYVHEGHYTDTLIHRVVGNFVIQGGGHAASDMQLKPNHEAVVNESGNGMPNKRGAVGLARGDAPHSGNSQFYVNISDNPDLDPVVTRWGYAVFGHVIDGMDVVDRIGAVATGAVGPFKSDSPLKPVIIQKIEEVEVTVVPGSSATAPAAPAPSGPAAAPAPPPASSPPPH